MGQQTPLNPDGALLLPLPRPVPDWAAQILEYLYLLGVTLWLGVHGSTALLTAPLVTKMGPPTAEMAKLLIWLLQSLGYVATVASAILLLTILGMHLLGLRRPVTVLLQLSLVLLMTATALGPQIWIVPKLSALLRTSALSPEGLASQAGDVLVVATTGLGMMGLLHMLSGAILVSLATRRCYRYPVEEMALFNPPAPR